MVNINAKHAEIAEARRALNALTPAARLRLCLDMIAQTIPDMVEEAVARKIGLKIDEIAPQRAPRMPSNYTERALAFIAAHPGATTATVAGVIGKARGHTNSLLNAKRLDGTLEKRDRGWYIRPASG